MSKAIRVNAHAAPPLQPSECTPKQRAHATVISRTQRIHASRRAMVHILVTTRIAMVQLAKEAVSAHVHPAAQHVKRDETCAALAINRVRALPGHDARTTLQEKPCISQRASIARCPSLILSSLSHLPSLPSIGACRRGRRARSVRWPSARVIAAAPPVPPTASSRRGRAV